jgi:hypothetical protein
MGEVTTAACIARKQAQNGITQAFGRDQISGDDPRSRNTPNET